MFANTTKGEVTELLFASEILDRGGICSRPMTSDSYYDFIVDFGNGLKRVQIKKALKKPHKKQYHVKFKHSNGYYSPDDVDFLIAYCDGVWFIIPTVEAPKGCSLPTAETKESKYFKYQNNWAQL